MDEQSIEALVEAANQHEAETGALLKILEGRVASLPNVISLPEDAEDEPGIALRELVVEYINHVPPFITAVSFHAKAAGISDYVQPFLEVATNYFLEPVNADVAEEGLEAFMQQAYLSHRLIEEVNDQYIVRAGIPLIPMDITKANIIVHQLIGETLANSLDEVVEETAKQMTAQDSVYGSEEFKQYVETRKGKGWDQVWKQWSDMTNTLIINLDFENRRKKNSQ